LSYKKHVQEPKKELSETLQKKKRVPDPNALDEIAPSQLKLAATPPDDDASAPISSAQLNEADNEDFLCPALYSAALAALKDRNIHGPKKTLLKSCEDVEAQGHHPYKARSIFKCASKIMEADDEEFLCSALYSAALDAMKDRNIHSPKKTLWKSCEDVEAQGHYPHKARSIFKCASKIIQNPQYFPSQIKGGIKSPANDPQFIAYCTDAITKHDTTALNCLYGEELAEFFRKCHHEFFHANPHVQHEILTPKCIAKIKKQMRLIGNSLNFVSARRFVI
jgi:hypothetical protein